MCLVLDANMFGLFVRQETKDMQLIHNWMDKKKGKIVYTNYGKYQTELSGKGGVKTQIQKTLGKLSSAGKARVILKEQVILAEKNMEQKKKSGEIQFQSDDLHILALAQASKAKLLCSKDTNLHKDFVNRQIIGGKVYQNENHAHLLRSDACP